MNHQVCLRGFRYSGTSVTWIGAWWRRIAGERGIIRGVSQRRDPYAPPRETTSRAEMPVWTIDGVFRTAHRQFRAQSVAVLSARVHSRDLELAGKPGVDRWGRFVLVALDLARG